MSDLAPAADADEQPPEFYLLLGATAFEAWRAAAQATVDDAMMKHVIARLHCAPRPLKSMFTA